MIKFSATVNDTFFPVGIDIGWRPHFVSFHFGIVSVGWYYERKHHVQEK
jgi:hypothetical protein